MTNGVNENCTTCAYTATMGEPCTSCVRTASEHPGAEQYSMWAPRERMTEVLKGCQHSGCNAPEGECSGACMPKPGVDYTVKLRFGLPPQPTSEAIDNPLMCELLGFLNDLTHPEQYGYAVTKEVRKRARELATAIENEERIP